MIYTEKNLRKVLRNLNPIQYDNLVRGDMRLPSILKEMFAQRFFEMIRGDNGKFITTDDRNILFIAYNDLYGNGNGYFKFDEISD